MSTRPRHQKLLAVTLSLSVAFAPAAPLTADTPPATSTVESADGLHVATFQTPEGRITVNLPGDMAGSDTISGTVFAEPAGHTAAETARAQDELSGYVVELAEQKAAVKERSGRWVIPAAATVATLVLRNREGQEVARAKVPVQSAAAAIPQAFELPSVGQAGKPLQVKGAFDGDFGTTAAKVAGQVAQVLAESPRQAVVRSPRDVVGSMPIELKERNTSVSCTYRNVGVRLSAGRTSLKSGETTTLQVAVLGLEGLEQPLPVRLVNRSSSVVRLEGGDSQSFTTEVAQVQSGQYSTRRTLTGVRPGGFTISAVVEQPRGAAASCAPAGDSRPQSAGGGQVPPAQVGQDKVASAGAAQVRLDRIVYPAGSGATATVRLHSPRSSEGELLLAFAAPETRDAEVVPLAATSEPGRYVTQRPLPIAAAGEAPRPGDGTLEARPNEVFLAMFFFRHHGPAGRGDVAADFGLLEDPSFRDAASRIVPEIAMSEDEKVVPAGGKRIGTLARAAGGAVQVPLEELVFYPKDEDQLKDFLAESGGRVLMAEPEEASPGRSVRAHLLGLSAEAADVEHLPQMRALFGDKETLYASSKEALQIYTLAIAGLLDGFAVALNPRLQYMSGPSTRDDSSINAINNAPCAPGSTAPCYTTLGVFDDRLVGVPRAWSFLALWDRDQARIPVAFLDQGFAPNPDFRGYLDGTMRECNVEDRGPLDVRCGRGQAAGMPTVGNSFFGMPSWHGNGVVTTAAGVLNNGWGSAGTGGQVVVPMLYKMGLRSYAFEMGITMRRAVDDGAAVVNISAGYPCRVLLNAGAFTGSVEICSAGSWLALCARLGATLHAATLLVCAVPIAGYIACPFAIAAEVTAIASCHTFALAVPSLSSGQLTLAAMYARDRGVPVVSIAGNAVAASNPICAFIPCGPQDAGQWQVVPGVIPGVICAGLANNAPPYENIEFFGPRVDLWTPKGDTFWAPPLPPTPDSRPSTHIATFDFRGTSAAAPFIAGVIAMMQAINPSLNPLTAPASGRAAIPDRITRLLTDTATSSAVLPTDPTGRRRNLINAFAALRAAATATVPNLSGRGYDFSLGFREADTPTQTGDFEINGPILRADTGSEASDTILSIPRGSGPGTFAFADRDWFQISIPAMPGLYEATARLRYPAGFGDLVLRSGGLPLLPMSRTVEGIEQVNEYAFRGLLSSAVLPVEVGGSPGADGGSSDNVFKLQVLPARRTGEAPRPDRFDAPGRGANNDEPVTAASLGPGGEVPWSTGAGGRREVALSGLSFHDGSDRDWFVVSPPADHVDGPCRACESPTLTIATTPGLSISVYNNTRSRRLRGPATTPVTLTCADYRNNFPLRFELTNGGRGVEYELLVTWEVPDQRFCALREILRRRDDQAVIDLLRGGQVIIDPLDDPPPGGLDAQGRLVKPSVYAIEWQGGALRIEGRVEKGQPLSLQLLDDQGRLVAKAATAGLEDGPPAIGAREGDGLLDVLVVEASVPAGLYVLSVGHRRPESAVELKLEDKR